MTQEQHPITPPPELVQRWLSEGHHQDYCSATEHAIAQAARWGADQELKACCEWLDIPNNRHGSGDGWLISMRLHAARRPKPPSLKEQALEALDHIVRYSSTDRGAETIRRALEALPDD